MKTMTAAQAKTHFGKFLDYAQREPILVTKKNRPVGVFFSLEDIKNTWWAQEANKVHAEGYVGEKESASLLKKLLNA